MTDHTHPSYPSPTIQEALCEIRFPADAGLFSSQFAGVWDCLRGEFPRLETQVDVLPAPFANVILSGPLPTQPRFILRHAHRQVLLQFAPGSFALNTLSPYLGWQTMREDIEAAWQSVQEVLTPPSVTSITVRYINHVPLLSENAQGWLKAGDYLPTAALNATPPFQSRVQTGTGTGNTTTLTIGHSGPPSIPRFAMIVDMERSVSGEFPTEAAEVISRAEALHSDIWDIFAAIKGPRWDDILEGKQR